MGIDRMGSMTYQRKENDGNQILELFHQCDRKTTIMRDDQSSDETA